MLEYIYSIESLSNHPIATAVASYKKDIEKLEVKDYIEYSGHGLYGIINGKEILFGNKKLMEKYNVDPGSIVLEITESASIAEKAILLENMNRLRKVGVRFALDDFGTGQCNLNYIVEMPVDIVKFDSVMTKAYFKNGKGKLVMDAAMGMIHKLNLEIVSEGIEEKKQFERLDDLGIDYIQGYYFSKPKEQDDFINFIKENNQA